MDDGCFEGRRSRPEVFGLIVSISVLARARSGQGHRGSIPAARARLGLEGNIASPAITSPSPRGHPGRGCDSKLLS